MQLDKDLEALWKLQEVRKAYDNFVNERSRLKNLSDIKIKEEKLASAEKDLAEVQERIELLSKNAKNQEINCERLIQKSRDLEKEMFKENAKAKELSSLQQQLDHTKKELDALENTVINTAYEIEGLKEREEEIKKKIKELESDLAAAKANREVRIQEIDEQLKELQEEYERIKKEISPEVLKVYARKFNQYKTTTLAEINKKTCGGCHIHLPIYIVMEAKKKTSLVTCENCGRILYYRT
ncbi:MAG TPA: hypothetical protein DEA47_02655 [Peptococcaceae bacterium]|nr:MAG: Uncharacterized protein XD50_0028 [Clostridia bacterium 41_269]HBT20260.1 hypothetical protein [Peptococcaceae bacterium]